MNHYPTPHPNYYASLAPDPDQPSPPNNYMSRPPTHVEQQSADNVNISSPLLHARVQPSATTEVAHVATTNTMTNAGKRRRLSPPPGHNVSNEIRGHVLNDLVRRHLAKIKQNARTHQN